MRNLRSIMGITWRDKISNDKVLENGGLSSLRSILIHMNLQWLEQLETMDHERLPRQILYSKFQKEKRNQKRPRIKFKKKVKRNIKEINIDKCTWQEKAKRRESWRSVIRLTGVSHCRTDRLLMMLLLSA